MQAGRARHRIIIQQDQPTQGADGAYNPNWVTLAVVPCEGGPLTGRELWAARQVQSEITHRFKCRWGSAISDLSGNVRLIFNGTTRVMHVLAALNVGEISKEWQLDCKEAPDSTAVIVPPDFFSYSP